MILHYTTDEARRNSIPRPSLPPPPPRSGGGGGRESSLFLISCGSAESSLHRGKLGGGGSPYSKGYVPCVYLPIPLQKLVLERNNLYLDAPVHFPQSRPTLEQPSAWLCDALPADSRQGSRARWWRRSAAATSGSRLNEPNYFVFAHRFPAARKNRHDGRWTHRRAC